MSSRYSSCFALISPDDPLAQHLREPDDRVQRRPQLVGHVGQELRLVLARRLELLVEALSSSFIRFTLAASAPSSSRLVTSTCPEKSPEAIAASRESIRWIGPISDHERTNPSSSARTIAPAATPMNRFRELVVRARVLGDQGVGPRRRGIGELGRELVEVDGEQLGLVRRDGSCRRRAGRRR